MRKIRRRLLLAYNLFYALPLILGIYKLITNMTGFGVKDIVVLLFNIAYIYFYQQSFNLQRLFLSKGNFKKLVKNTLLLGFFAFVVYIYLFSK